MRRAIRPERPPGLPQRPQALVVRDGVLDDHPLHALRPRHRHVKRRLGLRPEVWARAAKGQANTESKKTARRSGPFRQHQSMISTMR